MRAIDYAVCVLCTLAAVAAFPQTPAPEATYVSPETCRICHDKPSTGDQWGMWKKSPHAQAYNVLQGSEASQITAKAGLKTPAAESPQCLRCHVTAYRFKTSSVPSGIQIKDGVDCQACHGPGSLHQQDGITFMFHPDQAAKIDLSAHILRPDDKTCVRCHNAESPTWNPEKYTLPDGKKAGFDYKQAYAKIAHSVPGKAPWIK